MSGLEEACGHANSKAVEKRKEETNEIQMGINEMSQKIAW